MPSSDPDDGMPLSDPSSKKLQILMLSITLTDKVEDLKELVMKEHETIEEAAVSVPSGMKQLYVATGARTKLVVLASLILSRVQRDECKMFVFMNTRQMVEFYKELFHRVVVEGVLKGDDCVKVFGLHGSIEQRERVAIFKEFRAVKKGVIFCTVTNRI